MRHLKAGKKFGRNSSHRRAMMRNLVTSLFVHERITTTDTKAKELRRVAERLVTKAARVSALAEADPRRLSLEDRSRLLHVKRTVMKHIRSKATDRSSKEVDVVWKLFSVLGPRFSERKGGYTRIVKLPNNRKGDNAPLSIIEFVDYDMKSLESAAGKDSQQSEKKGGLLSGIFGGRKKNDKNEDDDE